jgi:hypothetical protein
MKKLILTLTAVGFAATTFAHGGMMEPGSILLYGVGTYSSQHGTTTNKFGTANANTADNPRMRNWEVSPGVGFNILPNLAIGVDAYYTASRTTYDKKTLGSFPNIDQVKTYDYGVGPFVRYTQPLSQYFFAFGQFSAHYIKGRETFRTVTAQIGGNSYVKDDNYKGFDVSFVPAVGAMLTKTWGLTFSVGGVGYQYMKWDYSTQGLPAGSSKEMKDNNFTITFGQQFNLGIQKYINCGGRRHHHMEPMDDTRRMDVSDDEDDSNSRRRNRRNDDE